MKFHAKKLSVLFRKSALDNADNNAPKAGKRGFFKTLFGGR
jgi:hypothetical protein